MRFIFAGCCARTASGQAVAAPTPAMKSRRFIANPPDALNPSVSNFSAQV
jgi:hypothetical protein